MKILLVEDRVGQVLLKVLEKAGHEVVLAEDGEDAFQKLNQDSIQFFLVDWMLPGMSGLELVERIRRIGRYRETPILVISSRASREDVGRIAQAGVDGFVAKPFTPVQLRQKIDDVLRKREQSQRTRLEAQQIVSGQMAFGLGDSAPVVLFCVGGSTEEAVSSAGDTCVSGLADMVEAMGALNAEHPALGLGYRLVQSTNDLAQLLGRRNVRARTRMVVLSTACRGNYVLLLRLLGRGEIESIPFLLMCWDAGTLPDEVEEAVDRGALHMLAWPIDLGEWRAMLRRYVPIPP